MLSSFLLIPIITRYVGESEYGLWMSILAVVAIFAAAGGGHMHGAMIRYTPVEKTTGQTFVDTGFLLAAISGLFLTVFVISSFFIDVLPFEKVARNRWHVIISVSLLIIVTISSNFIKNYPRSKGQVKTYEVIQIIEMSTYLIALPVGFLISRSILVGIWILVFLYGGISIGLLLYYYPEWVQLPATSNFEDLLRYAIPMIPKELSSRVFSQIDRYLILLFISPTAVAIYAIIDQVSTLFRTMTGILNSTLYPSVTAAWESGEYEELCRLYSAILRGYVLLAIPAFAGLTILATPVLTLLSTPEIADRGADLLPLLAVGYLIWGVENPLAYILSANEQTNKIAGITVVVAIGNILLNILLLPFFGLLGAITATITMQFTKTAYIIYIAYDSVKFDFPIAPTIKAVFSTGIMTITIYIIPISGNIASILIYPLTGFIIYFLVLYTVNGFTKEEIKFVATSNSDF
ncbi:lipopolysaccharide biosynthesis protein [Natronorarus salvus]|uniref:lipopolysaccharide biosynthesis protein n=1 Tax=Natronorarus salvus TaxID=3117733 RepID=UPI002F267018